MAIQRVFVKRVQIPPEQLTRPSEPEFYEPGDHCWELNEEPQPGDKVKILSMGGPMIVDRDVLSTKQGW